MKNKKEFSLMNKLCLTKANRFLFHSMTLYFVFFFYFVYLCVHTIFFSVLLFIFRIECIQPLESKHFYCPFQYKNINISFSPAEWIKLTLHKTFFVVQHNHGQFNPIVHNEWMPQQRGNRRTEEELFR